MFDEFLIKNFPLLLQLDNIQHPYGSCNMTSLGMCLVHYKKSVTPNYGYAQIEDQLLANCSQRGLSRHEPGTIKFLAELYGLQDNLLICDGWKQVGNTLYRQVIPHLKLGKPAIVHGMFTSVGHIVCVDGIRLISGAPVAWHIADPYGEWYKQGYQRNYGGDRNLGRYWMSHQTFASTALADGVLWIHLIENR